MPKKGQTRELPTDLRVTVAENLMGLMASHPILNTDKAVERASGVGYRTVGRMRDAEVAANLDTIQAVATAFDVQPWQLLIRGETQSVLSKVFSKPVPDSRLGQAWTRPDKKLKQPLLQSSGTTTKVKIRVRKYRNA